MLWNVFFCLKIFLEPCFYFSQAHQADEGVFIYPWDELLETSLAQKDEMNCVLIVEKTAYFVIVNEYTWLIKEKKKIILISENFQSIKK